MLILTTAGSQLHNSGWLKGKHRPVLFYLDPSIETHLFITEIGCLISNFFTIVKEWVVLKSSLGWNNSHFLI